MSDTVIIYVDELRELKEDQALLRALQAGGVESWDWYDASIEDHYVAPTNPSE